MRCEIILPEDHLIDELQTHFVMNSEMDCMKERMNELAIELSIVKNKLYELEHRHD